MIITITFERDTPIHQRIYRLKLGRGLGGPISRGADDKSSLEIRLLGDELDQLRTGKMRRAVFDGYYLVMASDWQLSVCNVSSVEGDGAQTVEWQTVRVNVRRLIDAIRKVEGGNMKVPRFTYDTNERPPAPFYSTLSPVALIKRSYGWIGGDRYGQVRLAKSLLSFKRSLKPEKWDRFIAAASRMSGLWGCGNDEIGFTVHGYTGAFILRGDDFSSHT